MLTRGDEHGGQRVTLREPDRTVHRAVEVGFAPQSIAPVACLDIGDGARRQVGIDRHLPAGQRVQREPRRDFRDADRAVVDDDVLNRDEHQEDDDAHDEVAADHELAEGHDDAAGGFDAVAAVEQHESRGRHVERQADQREQAGATTGRPRNPPAAGRRSPSAGAPPPGRCRSTAADRAGSSAAGRSSAARPT